MKKLLKIAVYVLLLATFKLSLALSIGANHGSYAKALSKPLMSSLSPIIKRVKPGIVNIHAEGKIDVPTLALRRGQSGAPTLGAGKPVKRKFEKLGSGVVMDPHHGYIITNAHVVKDADKITVKLANGEVATAKLVGADAQSDIAVLQVSGMHLVALPTANSSKLDVGDFVAAIGNPFGLSQTVTFGIVSATQRNDLNIEGFENFIQTDAAINPGNSGGALIDMRGRLIGINTAILSPAGGNIGIGFAIPIDMAKSIMQQLIKYGEVRRGVLGLYAQSVTPELAKAMDIKKASGVVVTSVNPGSPADKAGLKVGDVITEINRQDIKDPFQLRNVLGLLRVNSMVRIKVIRKNKHLTLTTTITAAKAQMAAEQRSNPFLNGVRLAVVNQTINSSMHGNTIQVVTVNEESPAWQSGLRPGDVIVSANMQPVHSISELNQAARTHKDHLLLNIMRGEGAMFIVIK